MHFWPFAESSRSQARRNDAGAQLNECALIDQLGLIDAPGGCIEKSLAMQIGPGQGDINTPGSSAYLITRDPARAIRRGRQLFQRKFSLYEGLGPRVTNDSTGDIMETRRLGAGLSDSCAACHGRPRGSAGVGGDVATFPDSRDAPHLFGLGLIEMLADEMTADLRAIRTQALNEAKTGIVATATGRDDAMPPPRPPRPTPVTRPLVEQGRQLRPDHGASRRPRRHLGRQRRRRGSARAAVPAPRADGVDPRVPRRRVPRRDGPAGVRTRCSARRRIPSLRRRP